MALVAHIEAPVDVLTFWLTHTPPQPDPHSQRAALCRVWQYDWRGVSPTSSLSISRQDEQEEVVQSLLTDVGGQWHGKIKEQFYQGT